MPTSSLLDPGQIVKGAYDDATQSHKVKITNTAVPVTIVDGAVNGLDVILSTEIPAASINGSGGAFTVVSASTTAQISIVVPNEQTGVAIGLYKGAAAAETLIAIIAPGQDNEFNAFIPAGTRLTVKATGASAPVAGSLFLSLLG